MTDPAGMRRSSAALRAQIEELSAAYERIRADTRRIHGEMASLKGKAESADAMVTAQVGQGGRLLSLTIDPRTGRRVSTEELAGTIVATVNRAAADARAKAATLLAPILPPGFRAEDVVAGTADLLDWQPAPQPADESGLDSWLTLVNKERRP